MYPNSDRDRLTLDTKVVGEPSLKDK